jgi:phospholipid-binding lipoprotein MlaA
LTVAALAPALLLSTAPALPTVIDVTPATFAPAIALVAPVQQPPAGAVPAAPLLTTPAAPEQDAAQPDVLAPEAPPPAPAQTPAPAEAASTGAPPTHTPGDPLEKFNRTMFEGHQAVDKVFLGPVSRLYIHVIPKFVRSAVHNMLVTLTEPVVLLNFVLQHKFGKAAETGARFIFNTTVGLAGTIDFAKGHGIDLPHRSNGFGNTLGFYGVKPGPYLFLPFVGPSDLRDIIGGQIDGLVMPLVIGKGFYEPDFLIPYVIASSLDQRSRADADLKSLFAGAVDPYATLRSVYLQDRAGEIAALKGQTVTTTSPMDTDLVDPEAKAPAASPAPELQDPLSDPDAKGTHPPSGTPELRDLMGDPGTSSPPAQPLQSPAGN